MPRAAERPRASASTGAGGRRTRALPRPLKGLGLAAVCLLLLAAVPVTASGQESSGSSADSATAGGADAAADTGIVYRREIFTYPSGVRRDPFRPVTAGEAPGPRFEDLSLSGIIYSPSIGSIAVVVDGSRDKRYRLREGERLGAVRVVDIRPNEVVFSVSGTLGQQRREVLRVQKEEEPQG